jgi:hypothetical protein
LNKHIKSTKTKSAITTLLRKEGPGPDDFPGEFYQTFKESKKMKERRKN